MSAPARKEPHALPWVIDPYRLWSLKEIMDTVHAGQFATLMRNLIDLKNEGAVLVAKHGAFTPYTAEVHKRFEHSGQIMESLFQMAQSIPYPMMARSIRRQVGHIQTGTCTIQQYVTYLEHLSLTIEDELSLNTFLFIPQSVAPLYEGYVGPDGQTSQLPFGELVDQAFSSARADIREAASCFALDRWTASTFHCMGAIEVGMKALCIELDAGLNLDDPGLTWIKMIQRLTSRIHEDGHTPAPRKTSHPNSWATDEPFFNGVIVTIKALARAFRNPTMHFRRVVESNPKDARKVLDRSKEFLEELAEFGISEETLNRAAV